MSFYSKYLIGAACLGLVGIPVFILDFSDLTWTNNKELYWGMIALCALIGAILLDNRARRIQDRMDREQKERDKINL